MTKSEALAEAARRWGKDAVVQLDETVPLGGEPLVSRRTGKEFGRRYRCTVGAIEAGAFVLVKGTGDTFEEAFKEADRRTQETS